jgi:hypothetical protein
MAMDKLQPLIKHHFWIVFLIALALPPIAWWMTTGELAAEISDRTSSLDSTLSGIANGQNAANADWANGVNQLIAIRTEANRLALDILWKAQTDLMVWPPNVAKWMDVCPYRGEIDDVRIKQILPDIYRGDYELAVRRVWLIPEPIDDGKTRVDQELKQKVVFPYESLPRIDAAKWSALPPTWQEIWNTQEDLWLLSEVLSAVRRTNDSTSSITDSYVKQILQVQLFGGKRAAAPASPGSTTTSSGYPGGGGGFPGMVPGGRTPARGGSAALSKPAEFSIGEEYEVVNAGGRGASGYMPAEGGPASPGSTADSDPNSDENRYVQSEEAYRTRGFKLKVAVDQMQVPTLIRELLNSQYPIEIIRFQQTAMNPEEPGKPAANRSGYPGGGSLSGMNSGYPGSSSGESPGEGGTLESFSSSEGENGFEGGGEDSGGLAGTTYAIPAIANVKAALEDRDLVELVVIGEIYIYNPPAVNESEQTVDAGNTSAAEAPTTDVDGPAVSVDADVQPTLPADGAGSSGTPSTSAEATSPDETTDAVPAATVPGAESADSVPQTEAQPSPVVAPTGATPSSGAAAEPGGDASPPSTDAQTP